MKVSTKSAVIQKPVDAFRACPRCHCKELIAVMGDVLCSSCPWDSIEAYASALFDKKIGVLFRPTERPVVQEDGLPAFNNTCHAASIIA